MSENVEAWNLELPNVHFEHYVQSWVIIIIKKITPQLSTPQCLFLYFQSTLKQIFSGCGEVIRVEVHEK